MDKEIRNTGENFQETEFLKLKKPADDRIVLIEDLNENSDKIDKFCKDTENNKQNKEDITLPTTAKNIIGAIREIFVELWKIGSTTQFGRFKVGNNLNVDTKGFLHGSAPYTHPSGNGNTHLPSNGATGQFIKWLSAGVGQWAAITWGDITGKPSTFTPSSHTHSKSQITDFAHTHTKNQITDFSHTHDERYFTEAEILEKFKNFCPYSVGDIYITTLSNNPATKYLGTTWQKIEGRFLLSTSGSNASGQAGGSNTKTIAKANLPNIKLQVDAFSVTTSKFKLSADTGGTNNPWNNNIPYFPGTFGGAQGRDSEKPTFAKAWTDEGGGQNTGTASPYTSSLGSGTPLDITPSFYTVHIWKRLS